MRTIDLRYEIDYNDKAVDLAPKFITANGENINIAILDTGIDSSNTYVNKQIKAKVNFTSKNIEACNDIAGHGTFCAGIINANDGNILGVAPKANIYVVKVLNDRKHGCAEWIVKGIKWCIKNKIDIVNMSLGFKTDNYKMHNIMQQAYKNNITLVAAVGNDEENGIEYPAKYDEVFCVTSIGSKIPIDKDFILAAGGNNVISTFLYNQYATASGTSFATAKVTGALALIQSSAKKKYGYRFTNKELKKFIIDNVYFDGTTYRFF